MATKIYKNLAKIVGIVLVLVGIAAVIGGNFANSFIKEQMEAQAITFPDEAGIQAQVEGGRLTQEDADALMPYAGEQMTNGAQAKVYSDNFIYAHLKAGAKAAGVPEDKASYAGLGDLVGEKQAALTEALKADNPDASDEELAGMSAAEQANPDTEYPEAKEAKALQDMRMGTFLNGNTLRGLLLNVYGWGLVGQIALYVGIGAIIVGLALAIWGFIPSRKNDSDRDLNNDGRVSSTERKVTA